MQAALCTNGRGCSSRDTDYQGPQHHVVQRASLRGGRSVWWLVLHVIHQLTPQYCPTSKYYYYPPFTREGTEAHGSDTTSKVPEAVVA